MAFSRIIARVSGESDCLSADMGTIPF
jgi:hypothetical protein